MVCYHNLENANLLHASRSFHGKTVSFQVFVLAVVLVLKNVFIQLFLCDMI